MAMNIEQMQAQWMAENQRRLTLQQQMEQQWMAQQGAYSGLPGMPVQPPPQPQPMMQPMDEATRQRYMQTQASLAALPTQAPVVPAAAEQLQMPPEFAMQQRYKEAQAALPTQAPGQKQVALAPGQAQPMPMMTEDAMQQRLAQTQANFGQQQRWQQAPQAPQAPRDPFTGQNLTTEQRQVATNNAAQVAQIQGAQQPSAVAPDLARQQREQQFMAQQGAFTGQAGAPVPTGMINQLNAKADQERARVAQQPAAAQQPAVAARPEDAGAAGGDLQRQMEKQRSEAMKAQEAAMKQYSSKSQATI